MAEPHKEIQVKKSKSTVAGWLLKTGYETGLMLMTHSVAHSIWELADHGTKGFHLISPVTAAAAFASEFLGEGIKSVTGLNRVLAPKHDQDGLFTKQAKFLTRETFEGAIFTALMITYAGAAATPAGIVTLMASHYFAAGIKELFRGGTDQYYHAAKHTALGRQPKDAPAR